MRRNFAIFFVIFLLMPVLLFANGQKDRQMQEMKQIDSISVSISEMTGVAINPLLVTTAIGVYRNIKAGSADARSELPWYFQTWFILICGIMALLSFLISIPSITMNLPPQVSSIIEQSNKVIGLVLATPVVFDLISPISSLLANNVHAAITANEMHAYASVIPMGILAGILAGIPGFIWSVAASVMLFFVYVAIWLMNFTFDTIIFLCPFGWADAILKSMRAAYFTFLAILSAIYPPLAFIITLPVIIIAVILLGWSVRRFVMGFVFLKDFLSKRKETVIDEKGILAFSESGLGMIRKHLGRLKAENGKWIFTYRKLFITEKTITVDKAESILKKGFIYSEIRQNEKLLCSLPPRYQKIADQVQTNLNIEKVDDGGLKKGIKAFTAWIKNLFTGNRTAAAPANSLLAE